MTNFNVFFSLSVSLNLNNMPKLTKPAPQFAGKAVVDGQFKDIKLSDYKGKYVVLFFYPLDLWVTKCLRSYNWLSIFEFPSFLSALLSAQPRSLPTPIVLLNSVTSDAKLSVAPPTANFRISPGSTSHASKVVSAIWTFLCWATSQWRSLATMKSSTKNLVFHSVVSSLSMAIRICDRSPSMICPSADRWTRRCV